ncbi:Calmodulin binding protein [Rhynchospora pubera]|uniref:Calmodulin binding protein n=1 Tax=Rhynchospora pubera TaxID=906938 RepID=A0AAV8FXG2_9POAL|nr:Calmodulin binding protein [Rhynchospora pubera]
MAISRKRPLEGLEPEANQDHPQARRMRPMPSFYSVIRGALMAETIKGICSSLEPVIRRVVHDEVQLLVCGRNPLYGNRQYYIEQEVPTSQSRPLHSEHSPTHKLVFANEVPKSIYTGNNITGNDNKSIHIRLIDNKTGCTDEKVSHIKVKLVVIDGDLEKEGLDSDKFGSKIVQPRDGRRPLLVGNTEVVLNQGVGTVGDVYCTDNSKWLRCGKFRLGAFVDSEGSSNVIKIQEGLSDKFAVKDHRGELYKKNYPPQPNDEVWRLEIIAKDGKYHERLKENGVNNVQDFLKLLNADPTQLKKILKMSKNAWDKVVKHARTCPMGLDDVNLTYNENNANLPSWPEETGYRNGANPNLDWPACASFSPCFPHLDSAADSDSIPHGIWSLDDL